MCEEPFNKSYKGVTKNNNYLYIEQKVRFDRFLHNSKYLIAVK